MKKVGLVSKKVKKFFKNFWTVLNRREMTFLPGHLAFFFIMSIVPILTFIGYIASGLNLSLEFISEFLTNSFGKDISALIMPTINSGSVSIKFLVTLLIGFFTASNGAAAVIVTSNMIYGIEDKGFINRRIKAMVITLLIVLLFAFILVFPLFGDTLIQMIKLLNINNSIIDKIQIVINILKGPFSLLVTFFFIKIIYAMAPDKRIASSNVNYGAVFTSIVWVLITWLCSYLIHNQAYYSILYGGLANIIVLFLWFYFLAYAFTIGMALNYKEEINKLEGNLVVKVEEKK